MCLSNPKPISLKRKRSGYGYKVFLLYNNRIQFEWGSLGGKHECPAGEWLVAGETGSGYADIRGVHRPGFHIFKSRKAAAAYAYAGPSTSRVIKVRYSGAFVEGLQDNKFSALVADRMYVPKSELRRVRKTR